MKWEQFYQQRDRDIADLLSNITAHKEFIKTITDNAPIENAKESHLLEVGTGTGDMCIFMSWLGYKVTSIDNNEGVLQNVKSRSLMRTASTLKLLNQDAFNLSFSDKLFDVAFSQGFFEHFSNEDIVQLVKEQARVAKKVIFSVPSFQYPQKDFGNERLMRLDEWLTILKDFRISKSFYYGLNKSNICLVTDGRK